MEFSDILSIFWVIIIIVAAVSGSANSKKKKQQQQQTLQRAKQAAGQRQAQAVPAQRQPARSQTMLPPRPLAPTPHDHSGMFEGSLNADDGTEGSDPHDHGFDHEVDMPSMHSEEEINASLAEKPKAQAAKAPLLDWAPDSLVRAFVMQEVLKRPAERRG